MQEESCLKFPENGTNKLSTILQISDSVFPTGGFTHSMGCESAVQRFKITDEKSLKLFLVSNLENYGSNSLPYVKNSHTHCGDLTELMNLDYHYSTTHSNHIANRSSKQQGRSFAHVSSTTFNLPILNEMENLIDHDKIEAYHEIVFGFVCGSLGINLNDTLDIYLFGVLRTMVNSMVRLGKNLGPMKFLKIRHVCVEKHSGRISEYFNAQTSLIFNGITLMDNSIFLFILPLKESPLMAQTLQYDLQKMIPHIIRRNFGQGINEVCTKFPLPDLVQASHDTLFSRLFYS